MNSNPFMMPEQEGFIDIDNNSGNIDIDFAQSQSLVNGPMTMMAGPVTTSAPIIEPMRERIVNRTIEHVVPQEW